MSESLAIAIIVMLDTPTTALLEADETRAAGRSGSTRQDKEGPREDTPELPGACQLHRGDPTGALVT